MTFIRSPKDSLLSWGSFTPPARSISRKRVFQASDTCSASMREPLKLSFTSATSAFGGAYGLFSFTASSSFDFGCKKAPQHKVGGAFFRTLFWRSRRDSNPRCRFCPHTPLAGEHLRPLGHDSGEDFDSSLRLR